MGAGAHIYNSHAPCLTVFNEELQEVCPRQHIQVDCDFIQQQHLQSKMFLPSGRFLWSQRVNRVPI